MSLPSLTQQYTLSAIYVGVYFLAHLVYKLLGVLILHNSKSTINNTY